MVAVFAIGIGSARLPRARKLASHGVVAQGHIVETNCGQHSTIQFQFVANGLVIAGHDSVANCSSVHSGDSLSVTYLPDAPDVNIAGSGTAHLHDETVGIAVGALFMSAFFLFGITYLVPRFSRNS